MDSFLCQVPAKTALIRIETEYSSACPDNDRVRNPLRVIVAIAGKIEDPAGDKILFHAPEINKIVTRLDRGWMESAIIHDFLTKYYHFYADYNIKMYNDPNTIEKR